MESQFILNELKLLYINYLEILIEKADELLAIQALIEKADKLLAIQAEEIVKIIEKK